MRQICNVSWVAQVEGMDEKEFKAFQRELPLDPAGPKISHGVPDLMKLMGRKA